jgi:RHS repeat-associated protein
VRKLLGFVVFVGLASFTAIAPNATAQVKTGIQPFNSYGGGPFERVNLANLNVHFDIPVTSKAGRGGAFTYALGYDSAVWYPVGSWIPVVNWGWRGETEAETGYVSFHSSQVKCFTSGNNWYWATIYSNFVYHDKLGASHGFDLPEISICPQYGQDYATATTTDGSGYQIQASTGSASIIDKAGRVFYPPVQSGSGPGSATDDNGNKVSFDGTTFTDTLGTAAIAVSGTSPIKFTYTAPSGASASYTVNYSTKTVRTNFGCSGVSEYGPLSQSLVSSIVLPDNTAYEINYEPTPGYSGDVTGRISSITLPTGGTISYAYQGANNGITCADGSTATLQRTTPDGVWTYAHSESGNAWTTNVTDPQVNATVINFQQTYETERQIYQGSTSGTLLRTVYTCYNGNAPNCNSTPVSVPITEKTLDVQWPGANGKYSRVNTLYNTYGLVTTIAEYDYGNGGPPSTPLRQTVTTYASLGNDIQNRPAQVTVYDSNSNIKAQTIYCYDEGTPSGSTTCAAAGAPTPTTGTPQHTSISGSRGNATTVNYLVSGSTYLAQKFTYYDTGNVNTATDVNGAVTTYNYGTGSCGNSFVTSISEPLSLSRSRTWNCTGGVRTSDTDENGKTTTINFSTDPDFWRPNSVVDQLSNTMNLTFTGATSAEGKLLFGNGSTIDVLATVDSQGRHHLSQLRQGPSSSTYDSIEADYDSNGRPDRTTLPYGGTAGQTNSSGPSTNFTYDALGRKYQVTDSGGKTVTFTYSQNNVYRTIAPAPSGENTKKSQFEYDALGRLTSVCEITGASSSGACGQTNNATGYWTKYTYDVLNHLTGVTQNAQSSNPQSRTFTYDGLGRMTSETVPETGNVTKYYFYDSDSTMCGNGAATSKGDLVKMVDAAGNCVMRYYDYLHRLTDEGNSNQGSTNPCKRFRYDNSSGYPGSTKPAGLTNTLGRLIEAATDSCSSGGDSIITDEWFSYTARGETSDLWESTLHSGGYYHTQASYWANGVLNTLNGSLGNVSTYGMTWYLDGEGRWSYAIDGNGYHTLGATTYNAASQATQIGFGTTDTDSYTYDPNTGRMTQYAFNVNGHSVNGTLTWNPVGTLSRLASSDPFNSANTQICSYTHDDLARIASVNCGSIWSQTFSYDPFGNLNKSGTNSFQPTYSYLTNRMTQIGGSTPSYDADGNVTNDFLHTYSWDVYGRPVTIDGGVITYDALGRMAERSSGGAYTIITYSPTGFKMQLTNGGLSVLKDFVPLSGGAMAVYTPAALYFRHSDWLGSSRFTSTSSRTMYSDEAYAPFGEAYAQAGSTDLSFTGMNQDTAANLYDFPAREYGIQGRWPSPDPAGLAATDLTDPQTLNRYAYVRNSPLHFVDPQGLELCEPAGCTGYGGGGGGDDGYCPPEYEYCGSDPFGNDGGEGILVAPPNSAPLPPNGIDWQGVLFGSNGMIINNAFGQDPCPSIPLVHWYCERLRNNANLDTDTGIFNATSPCWGSFSLICVTLREINQLAYVNKIIDTVLIDKSFATLPVIGIEQDQISGKSEEEIADLISKVRDKNYQKIGQLLEELGRGR